MRCGGVRAAAGLWVEVWRWEGPNSPAAVRRCSKTSSESSDIQRVLNECLEAVLEAEH